MSAPIASLAGFDRRILLYGCGHMAGAMLGRWLDCGLDPARAQVIRRSGAAVAPGVAVHTDPGRLAPPDMLMLAVEPHQLGAIADAAARLIGPDTILLSILAGVTLDDLAVRFLAARAIVRVMPNMPVRHGAGVVGLAGAVDDSAARAMTERLMAPLGLVHWLADEAQFDALTALTGSGPAFVYRFLDALRAGGEALGFDRATAARLARATVIGAGDTLSRDAIDAADLIAGVARPGGMTEAGLDVLNADGALDTLVAAMLRAARDRGKDMAARARA